MKYPPYFQKGDIVGICAPSSGVPENLHPRLESAIASLENLGYTCIETESVRKTSKCVSTDSAQRAKEFMELYENHTVKLILPPWGGEFLMDMLPLLDFEYIKNLPPKWICGYSDITTLTFPLTLLCDVATVHGSNLMNMGLPELHQMDAFLFEALGKSEFVQQNSKCSGGYLEDFSAYALNEKTEWKSLFGQNKIQCSGRMIGGCMDVLCKILGTRFVPLDAFQQRYRDDGFIWTLESCEMSAADIYRTLWQMRECGWFRYANSILIGRPDEYRDTKDFSLVDALERSFAGLDIPVIYDADIGHRPPQMQIINGSIGTVVWENGAGSLMQTYEI